MLTLNDIRASFLEYFQERDHAVLPSGPLVPFNDPTLLFTNSGMVQFKDIFTGRQTRTVPRAVTAQKCVRAGGKHNDLDNVGYTARHHTFFEMLGNFSFGDYFKEQAIPLAWELVVKEFGLSKDRLLVTVFAEDDDAAEIWRKVSGFGDDRILRIATADNFWMMGATGPCGPCSEIFYDHGEDVPGGPPGSPDEDGDRFVEIWNLVFMQFEQFEDERRESLPRPSIDTGMGLERVGAVLQGKRDNYDTDLFQAIISDSAEASNTEPGGTYSVHHRVIADHLRSACFLMADGVLPSNEGRGYVLRRIMRRAMRHAHLLGTTEPLIWQLVPTLVRKMGQAFPELEASQALAEETLRLEESKFRETLQRGLGLLDQEVAKLGEQEALPGDVVFRLFDTYGFPADLTQDAMREQGRQIDLAGFEAAMAEQRERSRASRDIGGAGSEEHAALWFAINEAIPATEFLGYRTEEASGQVRALVRDGVQVDQVAAGERASIAVNQSPFYAESGGQVGDRGVIESEGGRAEVVDTQRRGALIEHVVEVTTGLLAVGDAVNLSVDRGARTRIRCNHSATHLLHEALRENLGDHVEQRGSLVASDRLRFDFAHGQAVDGEVLRRIEVAVNDRIRENSEVSVRIMALDDAMASGARALFGEKYGDEVRVVAMGHRAPGTAYSVELCGGTHVRQTGDIGLFKIVGEDSVAAGIRRVEALTGDAAFDFISTRDEILQSAAAALRVRPEEVGERVGALMERRRHAEAELTELRRQVAAGEVTKELDEIREVAGIPFLARHVHDVAPKDLRSIVDSCKQQLPSGVVAILAETGGKVAVAVGVSDDLTERVSAVDLVRAAAEELGGSGGGGRPDLAQAGGPDVSRVSEAVRAIELAMA